MNAGKCIVGVVATLILLGNTISVSAKDPDVFNYLQGGGECFAKNTSTELIHAYNNWCEASYQGNGDNKATKKKNNDKKITFIPTPKVVLVIPTVVVNNTPEVENTPTPPVVDNTPVPTKECKNKNQYKDGTVDCNAGGGNG